LSDSFDTFDHSFAALFSTVNGDSLYTRFIQIAERNGTYTLIARFYEYSFVCLVCYAIINIFIAIIQESYSSARNQNSSRNTSKQEVVPPIRTFVSNSGSVTLPSNVYEELMAILNESQDEVSNLEAQVSKTKQKLKKLESLVQNQVQ